MKTYIHQLDDVVDEWTLSLVWGGAAGRTTNLEKSSSQE